MAPVQIDYYSDVLCIWAYVAHRRVAELAQTFGARITVATRYCSVFSDAVGKIAAKGGFEAFNAHLREVAQRFPHVDVDDRIWLAARPPSSAPAHLFLKAVELLEHEPSDAASYLERLSTRAAWELRRVFFAEAADVADWRTHQEIARRVGVDYDAIVDQARAGEAVTALAQDYDHAHALGVAGSPTFILNDGRQKLFGNVGYRVLEANVEELLRAPAEDAASWC